MKKRMTQKMRSMPVNYNKIPKTATYKKKKMHFWPFLVPENLFSETS